MGPIEPANTSYTGKTVQQGYSFLDATKYSVGREILGSASLQLRRPELIEGKLDFIFTDVEVKRLAKDFRYVLILKFLSSRPNIDLICGHHENSWIARGSSG